MIRAFNNWAPWISGWENVLFLAMRKITNQPSLFFYFVLRLFFLKAIIKLDLIKILFFVFILLCHKLWYVILISSNSTKPVCSDTHIIFAFLSLLVLTLRERLFTNGGRKVKRWNWLLTPKDPFKVPVEPIICTQILQIVANLACVQLAVGSWDSSLSWMFNQRLATGGHWTNKIPATRSSFYSGIGWHGARHSQESDLHIRSKVLPCGMGAPRKEDCYCL